MARTALVARTDATLTEADVVDMRVRARTAQAVEITKPLASKTWAELTAEDRELVTKAIAIRLGIIAPDPEGKVVEVETKIATRTAVVATSRPALEALRRPQ